MIGNRMRTLHRAARLAAPLVIVASIGPQAAAGQQTPVGTVTFAGLPHHPLGAAILAEVPGGLDVRATDPKDEAGVRVDFGEAEFFRLRFPKPILAPDAPDGARLSVSVHDAAGRRLASLDGTDVGKEVRTTADFSGVGTSRFTVRALREGKTLVELPGREWVFVQVGLPSGFQTSIMKDGRLCVMMMWDEPMHVRFEDGPTVDADQVFLEQDGGPPQAQRSVRSMALAARGLGGFRIAREAIGLSRVPVALVGATRVEARAHGVVVQSTAAEGGVRIETDPVASARLDLASMVDAADGQDGGTMRVSTLDPKGVPLGSVSAVDEGERFRQTADFSPLGARQMTLRLEREGKLVKQVVVPVGTSTVEPGLGAAIRTSRMADGGLCIVFMWDEPQPVRIADGPPILADRLFHQARGAKPLPLEAIGGLEVVGRSYPPMTLVGFEAPVAAVTPVAAPAKIRVPVRKPN